MRAAQPPELQLAAAVREGNADRVRALIRNAEALAALPPRWLQKHGDSLVSLAQAAVPAAAMLPPPARGSPP